MTQKNERLFIKIVNLSKSPIHDVTYEMLKCNNRGDGIVDIEACKPAKSNVTTINKYDEKDNEAKYALRISYNECDNEIRNWINRGESYYLLFNITAKHSFSGGIKTITKKYTSASIINGRFETKLSMNVLKD